MLIKLNGFNDKREPRCINTDFIVSITYRLNTHKDEVLLFISTIDGERTTSRYHIEDKEMAISMYDKLISIVNKSQKSTPNTSKKDKDTQLLQDILDGKDVDKYL